MRAILLLVILMLAAYRAEAAEITISENGQSEYTIVTSPQANATETLAAQELSKYLEAISGVRLEVTTETPAAGRAIVVSEIGHIGECPVPPGLSGDGYGMWTDGLKLYVVGGRGRSTLYAVYDLLDRLGCRFLAPSFGHYQGSSEIIPKNRSLSIDLSAPIIEKPVLAIRKLYVEEGHSHNAENLAQMAEWMPKARFNTLVIPTNYQGAGRVMWDNWREKITPELQKRDLIVEVGGHGYQNFLNAEMEGGKLFDQHAEWFGVDDTGARTRSHNRVFCTSNPDAVKYLAANLISYLKGRPEIQIFDFWPPDGAKWCACAKCKALGTPSNRQAILISQVKDDLTKAGVNTRLETIAYAAAVTPPESAKLIPSLLLDFCPIAQCFEVQINDPSSEKNADYVKQLKGLRKGFDGDISIYSYYRKYAWKSLPNLIPHYMQKDLQFYLTIPTQGISSYAEPGDWFAYELNHYVLGNLAWNPNADVDVLIRKFADARYGSAADTAIRTYVVLEDVVRHYCNIPGTTLKTPEEISKAVERIKVAEDDMAKARSSANEEPIKRNIGRLLLTLEYVRRDMEIQKSRAAGEPADQTRKLIDALHIFLDQHGTDGVFVLHSRIEPPKSYQQYGVAPGKG